MLKDISKPAILIFSTLYHPLRLVKSGIKKGMERLFSNRITQLITLPKKNLFTSMLKSEILNKIKIDESQIQGIITTPSQTKPYTVLKKRKFKRILIANRGEIALRIIRACRELGIKAHIVYTTHDKDSLAVKQADKAYFIGKAGYLNPKRIIEIAKKAKVDAIHPGYGFLAENPKFAELCEENKIKFIGPSSKTIKLLGDKVKAREVMTNAGIPIIGGTKRALVDINDASNVAQKIGWPVLLKASSGGGGKGVRIVNNTDELPKSYLAAQQEAFSAFGDSRLYIEKYIQEPRHIEFQILEDRYGNVIHLGERECSIQRRYQKLIEEAPSIAITPELRDKMGAIAVKIAKMIGYEGAGTVEFLLDKNNNFYFIEMNTRIQVEHGITEIVTGVDLVKEQIKIAAGAKLAYPQEDIKINGFAIECRINAESPKEDFSPCVGTISNYLPPGGPGIRVCSSSHTGHVVSTQYDSLIAKLMCSGKTRKEAIARMRRALGEFIIEGIETTIDFHKLILREKDFIKGNIDTHFIEKHNILEKLGKTSQEKKEPTKQEKMLIISTAVSKYIEEKGINNNGNRINPWVVAGRQEAMNEG